MNRHDYTEEAKVLFANFAERHGLSYEAAHDGPIEVLWTFPEQEGLAQAITLGLQNLDELNFGVSDFWSYFFPFEKAAADFEEVLNAWVIGEARIAVTGPWGRLLQIWDKGKWRTVYGANRCLPLWGNPRRTIENRPLGR